MSATIVVLLVINVVFDALVIAFVSSKNSMSKARDRVLFKKFKAVEQSFWLCKRLLEHQELLLMQQVGPGASTRTQWDTLPKKR